MVDNTTNDKKTNFSPGQISNLQHKHYNKMINKGKKIIKHIVAAIKTYRGSNKTIVAAIKHIVVAITTYRGSNKTYRGSNENISW